MFLSLGFKVSISTTKLFRGDSFTPRPPIITYLKAEIPQGLKLFNFSLGYSRKFHNPLSTGLNLPSLTVTKNAFPNRSLSSENWSGYPDVSFLGRLAFANFLNTEFLLALPHKDCINA